MASTDLSPGTSSPDTVASSDAEPQTDTLIHDIQHATARLREQVSSVVVGQDEVIEQLFICLFTRGHAVLVGVPGLAKTLLVSTVAQTLSLEFNRIQFTPDLMPSDITGTEVIEENRTTGHRELRFVKGPVFANVILADEINRTPPKTQAALLEAMQEHHVTVGGVRHELPQPFFVLATQNPIEQEGTYPLPEAQLDRFMFMIQVGYPSEAEEMSIVKRTTARGEAKVEPVLDAKEVMRIGELVRDVPVADHVIRYALRLVRATRAPGVSSASFSGVSASADMATKVATPDTDSRPEFIQRYVNWGAGPRASQNLILAGKARAILRGRTHVAPEDIAAVAAPVLRHRLIPNFNAEADGVTPDNLVAQLLETVKVDDDADSQAGRVLR